MRRETWIRVREEAFPTWHAVVIALVVCVVVPIVLVSLQIHQNPRFSATDETAHFDYIDRIADGSVPRQGQAILPSTRREVGCRGTEVAGFDEPPCGASKLPHQEPADVFYQYEAQQPPTYYAVTVPLRWITEHVFQVDNRLDATRVTGIMWLTAGLLLAWAAGRLMRIGVVPLGVTLLLLAAAPLSISHAATVSNDAAAIFAGSLIAIIGALAYRRGDRRLPVVVLLLAGAFVVSLKATNIFPVLAVAALFGIAVIAERRGHERPFATFRRWWRVGGWLILGGAVVGIAWVLIHRSLALIPLSEDPSFGILRLEKSYSTWNVLPQAAGLLEPLTGLFTTAGTLGQNVETPFYKALQFLIVGAALAGLFVAPRRWNHWLGLISLAVLYVGGVLLGLSVAFSYDVNPGLSGRYGLSVAPLLILVLGASLVGRWAVRAVGAFAVAMTLTIFAVMVT